MDPMDPGMDRGAAPEGRGPALHPLREPYATHALPVGDGHVLHVEEVGSPAGLPVVVLHGGPGGGCSPMMRRFFDPRHFRAVLFDQRGCGRSRPHASVEANTTWHLVADIESIREALGIPAWAAVFGGSWGATLALLYAQAHPGRVRSLVLRGVFLMTQAELDWFYGGGAGAFFPELWARFAGLVPEAERGDLVAAYHRRLFGGDPGEELRHARAWAGWENALAAMEPEGAAGVHGPRVVSAPAFDAPADYARAFARIENHYFFHKGFLAPGDAILPNMGRLAGVAGTIVQGRYDMICPPASAHALHRAWPGSSLEIVPRAGHALSEPGIAQALLRAMDRLAARAGRAA